MVAAMSGGGKPCGPGGESRSLLCGGGNNSDTPCSSPRIRPAGSPPVNPLAFAFPPATTFACASGRLIVVSSTAEEDERFIIKFTGEWRPSSSSSPCLFLFSGCARRRRRGAWPPRWRSVPPPSAPAWLRRRSHHLFLSVISARRQPPSRCPSASASLPATATLPPPLLLLFIRSESAAPPVLDTLPFDSLHLPSCQFVDINHYRGPKFSHLTSKMEGYRAASLRGSMRRSMSSWRAGSTASGVFGRSGKEEDDEEALRWAGLEKLPTYDRMRRGIIAGGVGRMQEIELVQKRMKRNNLS